MTREELEVMFVPDDLRHSRAAQEFIQEGKAEGRVEGQLLAVPVLLRAGMTAEEIAAQLELDVKLVQAVASGAQRSSENGATPEGAGE